MVCQAILLLAVSSASNDIHHTSLTDDKMNPATSQKLILEDNNHLQILLCYLSLEGRIALFFGGIYKNSNYSHR